jgi:hypothetical protein
MMAAAQPASPPRAAQSLSSPHEVPHAHACKKPPRRSPLHASPRSFVWRIPILYGESLSGQKTAVQNDSMARGGG